MKAETRKKVNLMGSKALQKYNNKRNNANSISCDYCNSFDTSRNNNKFSIWTKWGSKKGTRGSK